MMRGAFTLEEVSQLLNTVVLGIRTGEDAEDRLYSLEEVAERTGFAVRGLEDDCRSGLIEHTKRGRSLRMTSRQIGLLVKRHATGGDLNKTASSRIRSGARRAPRRVQ